VTDNNAFVVENNSVTVVERGSHQQEEGVTVPGADDVEFHSLLELDMVTVPYNADT